MNNVTQNVQEWFQRLREDFPLYCRTNIRIKTKAGNLVPFELNKMQMHLWTIVKKHIELGIPLKAFLIKLRQGGATTFWTVLIFWLTTLWPYRNALGIAHDEDAAKGVGSKWQNYYMQSNSNLRPKVRIMNRKEIYFATPLDEFEKTGDIGLDCHLDTFTIDKKEIGRSYTYQYGLLTEYARYNEVLSADTIEDRLTGIFNAIPDIPGVFTLIIKESTAAGDNYAKKDWDNPSSGFINIFISYVASEEYRRELLPSEYFELSEIEDSKYGDEVVERRKIIKQLAYWWPEINTESEIEHEVYCRLKWRRYAIDVLCLGKKIKFKQEYPTSIEDAFTYSSESIFPLERIAEMEEYLITKKPSSTNYRYHHDDEIKEATNKFYEARYGHLSISEAPIPGIVYTLGADGAQGIPKGDDSSAYVLRLPEMEEVACFSDIIIPDHFAGVLNYLGLLYNKALIGCEINDKGGFAAIEKLVNFYHYPNLYYRINPLKSVVENNIRYGWITNSESRQMMINDLTLLINNGDIIIKSKKLLSQMKSFILINGKPQAAPGEHDDILISAMIAVQMVRQTSVPREAIKPKTPPRFSFEWHMQNMNKSKSNRESFTRRAY